MAELTQTAPAPYFIKTDRKIKREKQQQSPSKAVRKNQEKNQAMAFGSRLYCYTYHCSYEGSHKKLWKGLYKRNYQPSTSQEEQSNPTSSL